MTIGVYLVTIGNPRLEASITFDVAAWNEASACTEALRIAEREGVLSTHVYRCVRVEMGGEVAASISPQPHHPAEERQV